MKRFFLPCLSILLFFCLQELAYGQDFLHTTEPVTTCSGNYYDSGGSTGNYGNQNGNSVFKTFTSGNGNRLKFSFTQFVTQGAGLDYLVAYDGPNSTYPIIEYYQGTLAPFFIESSGNSITFEFKSNFQTTYAGWAATIECTTSPLPVFNMSTGTVNTCSGMFYDNGGPNQGYPNFENRIQTICSNNGQRLKARFFPLQTSIGLGDTLWAYDGNSTSSPLLGAFTGGALIETLTSSGTCLTFRFTSDGVNPGNGWQAELSCTNTAPTATTFLISAGIRATCDGIFTDDGGETGNYSNLSGGTKTQTFTSYNGNRLKFNFQQFVLENGVDFLHVYDGPNSSYPVIGSYTGSLNPFSIEGSGSSLTFRFYSNYQTTYAGWRGTFECTTPVLPVYNMSSGTINSCSGMFYDNGGAIGDYPSFENRTETFCSSNSQKLVATFNPLEAQIGTNDTLWAYDGNSTTSPLLGIYVQNSTLETLTTSGTCLTFRFKSDATGGGKGWQAQISCTATTPGTATFEQSTGVRYVCDAIFTDDGGENGNYSNLSGGTKTQTFTSYNGNRLKFNFQQFILENGVDYLTVYDGPSVNHPVIGSYTGSLANFSVQGSGRSLTFRFYSNYQTSYAGWRGTFECTTPVLNVYNMNSGNVNACSGVFYDAGGASGNYSTFENRTQTFCSENGQKIQFNFNPLAFGLASGDTLWAYDGNSTSSPLIAIFISGSKIEPITSSGTCITWRFKSGFNTPNIGWAAEFQCVTAPTSQVVYAMSPGVRYTCGGLFTDDGGVNANYSHLSGGNIVQTFGSYNGERIRFDFQQFVLQSGVDYVSVYDGPSTNAPLLGTYSGTVNNLSITSSGRFLTFRFYSDYQTSYAGWQANISCAGPVLPVYNMTGGTTTSCLGVFYDAGGFQNNYPQFENRTQTFCAENGQKVQFNFNMLAYALQSGDSLWVFDGNSTSSPLKGIYVANTNVESLTSSGTCLTFRFKSGATNAQQGWQAILSCVTEAPSQVIYPISSGLRVVCSGIFTDDGGLNGNYSHLSGGTKTQTFQTGTNERLSVVFNSFSMETNVDYLDIYDGPNSNFPRLARLTGTLAAGATFTSTGTQLTFVMYSNYQTSSSGWVANFACSGPALTAYNMTTGTVNTCSGVFYDNGGGGNVYPNNENRTQTFCSDNGQKLVFDFTNFDLYDTDSLWVFDGNSTNGQLIGLFLLATLPEKITSSGTCLTFRFKSNASGQLNGWKALISCTPTAPTPVVFAMSSGIRASCSGVFTDDGGLTSNYSNSQNRVQTIQGLDGQRIRMNFQSFFTESGFDFLRIYDGPNVNAPIIGIYTGASSPGIVVSSGNSLTFWFTSDGGTSGNWAATIDCAGPVLTAYNMSSGSVTSCSGIFYDAGGVVGQYPNNENRTQTFCAEAGQKMQFSFNNKAFLLAGGDTLWAYDGNSTASPLIGYYVNGSYVENITSTGSCITYRFKSDNSNQNQGWAGILSCTSTVPTTTIYPMSTGLRVVCSGIFSDNGGPTASYGNSSNQTQTFQSPNNSRLKFDFVQFITESGFDYLDIYDGPSTAYPYLGRFTGGSSPGTILSSGNSLTFFFYSDGGTTNQGWVANISCAGPALPAFNMSSTPVNVCEGQWFDDAGPVQGYSHNQNVSQTFCSPNGNRMVFNFNKRVTSINSNDTLFAYDGNSTSSPLIGKYIGSGDFEPVVSSGTCLTFRFKSDATSNSTGWAALFYCTENPPQPDIFVMRNGTRVACSGIFTDDGGTTGSYSNSQTKNFTFQSNVAGAKLQFNFSQFALESGFDFLRIYDGADINATLIGTYSGTNNPGIITSTGSSLTFRFTSDGGTVASGWISSLACVSNVPLVGTLSNGPFCAGGAIQIPFTSPTQSAGNIFTAQLSDANGTFSSPTTIGTFTGTTSGTISGTLPSGLTTSGNYRIRILGSSPANSGSPSVPFTILALPAQPGSISGLSTVCAGTQSVVYSISPVSGASAYTWNLPSGATVVSGQGTTSIVVNWGSGSGNISVAATNTCGVSVVRNLSVTVNNATVPTATISSNQPGNQVCEGGSISFSALVSAGSNPAYQWILNGVDYPGATSPTFSLSNLISNFSVALRVSTTSGCFSPTSVTAPGISIVVQPSLPVSATISGSAIGNSTCSGNTVNFTSSIQNGGSSPSYFWRINGVAVSGANQSTFSTSSLQNGDQVSLVVNSSATCASPASQQSNTILMIVNQSVNPTISIFSNTGGNQVCGGNTLTLNASYTNGGSNPQFQWFRNGSIITDATGSTYTTPSDLTGSTNFTVRLTSDAICAVPNVITSASFQVNAVGSVTPTVTVSSSASGITCINTPITFTANPVNGGSNPTYQWRINGNPVANQTASTFITSTLANNDQVSVTITSNDPCANPQTATSTTTVVSISNQVVPSVSASSSVPGNAICAGQSITFTASPTNGGSNPGYIWRINGNVVAGQTASTFTTSSLTNGQQVSVQLTSSFSCASPQTATSPSILVTVNPAVSPTVSVSSSQGNSICQGTSTTLSANPTNGGSSPVYQWFADGILINGATNPTFNTPTNLTGSVVYTVQLTSNAVCVNPASVTSQNFTLGITPSITPAVNFSSSVPGNTICSGQSITFTAIPTNGGSTPGYQWRINNVDVPGQTNPTFSSTSISNNDLVSVRLTSNATCASPATVIAPNQTITVTPSSPAAVTVTSNVAGNTICPSQSITFTANPVNGGSNPTYQWKLNGNNINGETNPTYTTFGLANNDQISVQITSNSTCASPATGISPAITVTVIPAVVPSVSITSNPAGTTFCSGTAIQFTANPTNGGTTPVYSWQVNGNTIPNASGSSFSLTLNSASTVTATLTSNAACANPGTATSSGVALSVTPPPVVAAQNDTAICEATGSFNLLASPSGGLWSGTGVSSSGVFSPGVPGVYRAYYQFIDPNTTCTGRDSVTIQVKARPAINIPSVQPLCATANPVQLSATPTGGTWSGSGVSANGLFNPATTGPGQQVLTYTVLQNGCQASKILIVDVTAPPTVDVGGAETVCFSTQEVQFVGIPSGGTWTGNGVNASGLFTPGFVTPNTTVTLTYSVTVNGCSVSKTKQVTVSINPATVNAGTDQTVCLADGPFVLQGVVGAGGTWSGTGVTANGVFNPASSGLGSFTLTYTVTFIQSPTCQGSDTKIVTVVSSPAAPIAQGDTICRLGSGVLTANGVSAQFQWFTTPTGGSPISGQSGPIFNTPVLGVTTTYYVSQVAGTCESPRTPVTAFVNSFNEAAFSIVPGPPQSLSASPANGQYYQWMLSGIALAGANLSNYTPLISGDYSVIIGVDGCKDTSAVQFVVVTDVVQPIQKALWKAFPNPAQHELTVRGEGMEYARLFDMMGRMVLEKPLTFLEEKWDIRSLANGVYTLEISGSGRTEKQKLVVRR